MCGLATRVPVTTMLPAALSAIGAATAGGGGGAASIGGGAGTGGGGIGSARRLAVRLFR